MLEINQISVLRDNYIYLINDTSTGATAVVDPALAMPVLEQLDARNWQLDSILNTHHHSDHVGANLELKRKTDCTIIGAENDMQRIPGIGRTVVEGDVVMIGEHRATVLEVPGHTSAHIAYWFEEDAVLFCGDTLFSLGCGRLFEGTPEQMWNSLKKLRQLPECTEIYCAHEYTESNARFALQLEPNNGGLQEIAQIIQRQRARKLPTIPSTLRLEKQFNPFLRVDDCAFKAAVGMKNADPVQVFAAIRRQKDNFSG